MQLIFLQIGKHTISWISKVAMGFSGALIIAFAYSFRNGTGLAEACTAVLSGTFLILLPVGNFRSATSGPQLPVGGKALKLF